MGSFNGDESDGSSEYAECGWIPVRWPHSWIPFPALFERAQVGLRQALAGETTALDDLY